METLGFWMPIVALVLNLFVAWVAWSIRSLAKEELSRVTGEIHKRLGEHESQITDLRGKLAAQPKHDDLQVIHGRISEVKDKVYEIAGDLKGTHADVGGLKRSMDIIIKHHLKDADS